jgi:hypothetical protein
MSKKRLTHLNFRIIILVGEPRMVQVSIDFRGCGSPRFSPKMHIGIPGLLN